MGLWCCLGAIPTHLCCWLTKLAPFMGHATLLALLPWIPVAALAVVVLFILIDRISTDPHPTIRYARYVMAEIRFYIQAV